RRRLGRTAAWPDMVSKVLRLSGAERSSEGRRVSSRKFASAKYPGPSRWRALTLGCGSGSELRSGSRTHLLAQHLLAEHLRQLLAHRLVREVEAKRRHRDAARVDPPRVGAFLRARPAPLDRQPVVRIAPGILPLVDVE